MTLTTPTLAPPIYASLALLCNSTTFVPAFLAFVALFHLLAPVYHTPKQLSWILTTIASAIMVLASVPFVWDFVVSGWDVRDVSRRTMWGYTTCRIFQAYLVSDLIMGAKYYREQINFLTGWLHHALYIFIVEFAIRRAWTHIFCLCLLMELPTFILSVATLYPQFRSNTLFATTFFLTRIALHLVLVDAYFSARIEEGGGIPAGILAAVFPLHVFWFIGCIKGFVRRANIRRKRNTPASGETTRAKHGVSMDMPGGPFLLD